MREKRVSIVDGFSLRQIFSGLAEILNNKENVETVSVEELTVEKVSECGVTEEELKELKKSQNRIEAIEKEWKNIQKEVQDKRLKQTKRTEKVVGKMKAKDHTTEEKNQNEIEQVREQDENEQVL